MVANADAVNIAPLHDRKGVISAFDDDFAGRHVIKDFHNSVFNFTAGTVRSRRFRKNESRIYFRRGPNNILVNGLVSEIKAVFVGGRVPPIVGMERIPKRCMAAVVIKRFGRIAERGKRKRRGKRGEREALFHSPRGDAEAAGNHEFPFTEWGGGYKKPSSRKFFLEAIFS